MPKPGDIVVFNNQRHDFYSEAQRIFTRMPYTHTAVVMPLYEEEIPLLSADLVVTLTTWDKYISQRGMLYWVFSPPDSERLTNEELMGMYKKYIDDVYGFSQTLYFVYRWLMETFHKDVRKAHNPFPNGDICSELGYNGLKIMATRNAKLGGILNEWNQNTVSSGDIFNICTRIGYPVTESRTV